MTSTNETDNFYDWLMHSDAEDARKATSKCECGVSATYKGKKDFDVTYMHSYYCPLYKEKPKPENSDGK